MESFIKSIIKGIVKGVAYIYCKIVYRFEVKGAENIPKDGALIFCANHRSYLDPPIMILTAKRELRFIAKQELKENKFFTLLGWLFDIIFIKREQKDLVAMKESLKVLKNGECLSLFPEGTRNGIEKGEQVKDGVAFFALRSGAPVIPCGIKGGEKGNRKVVITYGKPLDFSEFKGNKDKEVLDKVTGEIMENIVSLAN